MAFTGSGTSGAVMCEVDAGFEEEAKIAFHWLSFVLVTRFFPKDLKVPRNQSWKYSIILQSLIPLAI
jgi:hypothetical protein